jgi:UDP-N-acetylmuramoyl-L-alanyl-D-glutamate--2,6-diaminopimelate ligase
VTLGDVARALNGKLTGADNSEVLDVTHDSRQAAAGSLFAAVRGGQLDAHRFIEQVMRQGAVGVISELERPADFSGAWIEVTEIRRAMALAAAEVHDHPSRELQLVGITGTNGKTTTTFLVRELLEAAGVQTGLLGTVTSIVGGNEEPVERTTPEAIDLQALFARMLREGDRAAAMEVSSHALHLGRAAGIHFAVRVFTNLTQDHLDFHKTMEDYYDAKRLLFTRAGGPSIVNVDDPYGRRLAGEIESPTTYAIDHDADYRAVDVRFDTNGSTFTLRHPDGQVELTTRLPGLFNVQNALAAVAAARALDVPMDTIARALADAGRVPGRFEPVDEGQDFAVLVDYAHTPDSLDNVLRAAREITRGRLHVVFGAGGDRDTAKRPLMGRAAAEHADRVIVTSDNPRSEDPEAIVDMVMAGAGPDAERIVDRRAAIARAIETAEPGDVVVIAGKGHEQGQEFENGRKEPFDDRTEARNALRAVRS